MLTTVCSVSLLHLLLTHYARTTRGGSVQIWPALGHVSYRRLMQHATATSCGLATAKYSWRAAETEAGLMPTPFIKCLHGATITLSASREEAILARDKHTDSRETFLFNLAWLNNLMKFTNPICIYNVKILLIFSSYYINLICKVFK